MTVKHFSALIEKSGTRARLVLPFNPNQVWGERQEHHLSGTVAGIGYRGQAQTDGSQYWLALGPAWLRDAHLPLGEPLEVRLEPEGPQLDNIAADIVAALAASAEARAFFEALPTFYRKNYMRWIDEARQAQTRAARIAETVRLLAAGQRQR